MFNRKLKQRIADLEDMIEFERAAKRSNDFVLAEQVKSKNVNEENREFRAAYSLLWNAHIDILERATEKPNGTVRRLIAISENALINDPISEVKPERKFSREAS